MATDRADLSVVRRIVYDNLGVTNQSSGYGNLQTNERYLTAYIDDAIAQADIHTMKLLLKQKQFHLMGEYWTTVAIPNGYRQTLPENDAILGVYYYTTTSGADAKAQYVSKDVFDMISEGGRFNITDYKGYYTIQDGEIQLIGDQIYAEAESVVVPVVGLDWTQLEVQTAPNPFSDDDTVYMTTTGLALPSPIARGTAYYIVDTASDLVSLSLTKGGAAITGDLSWDGTLSLQSTNQQIGYIKYIKFSHPDSLSSLYSPENLESALASYASAYLLMKRNDNPTQAKFYMDMYSQQIQSILAPISDADHNIEA